MIALSHFGKKTTKQRRKRSEKERIYRKEYLCGCYATDNTHFRMGCSRRNEFQWSFPWKRRAAGVDARKFGNEYVSDPSDSGLYVQSVCKAGKGQGVKRKRDGIDKPSCQSKLRSTETRDTSNVVTLAPVDS